MFQLIQVRGPGHVSIISAHETFEAAREAKADHVSGSECAMLRIWDAEENRYVEPDEFDDYTRADWGAPRYK